MPRKFFIDRIISFKDNDVYVAVSLEFDIVAEGDNTDQAIERLRDATLGYLEVCVEDKEPDEMIYRLAPEEYQKMWKEMYEIFGPVPSESTRGSIKRRETKMQKKEVHTRTETYEPSLA